MTDLPLLRYSLTWHKIAGGTSVVSNVDPLGWEGIELVLERDPKAHCVLELFEAKLTFAGAAYNLLKEAELYDGLDAHVDILFEILAVEATGWETFQTGLVDIKALGEETTDGGVFYKMTAPIIRNDLWTKFITRKKTPINIQKATDEDGNAVDVLTPKTQDLPSQKIRQLFKGTRVSSLFYDDLDTVNKYGIIECENTPRDEIKERNSFAKNISISGNVEGLPDLPDATWTTEFAGTYGFDIRINISGGVPVLSQVTDVIAKIKIGSAAPISFTVNQKNEVGNSWTELLYSASHTVPKGEKIRVYFEYTGATFRQFYWVSVQTFIEDYPNKFDVTADTTHSNSTCEAFLAHDVGYSIVDRMLGQSGYHKFYSEFFGHTSYTAKTYGAAGCAYKLAMTKGNQLRGRTLAAKPIFYSWDEYFDGLDNIYMLGYAPKVIGGQEMIMMENREKFYDVDTVTLVIKNIQTFRRTHDVSKLTNLVTIGYPNARVDEYGILDDPQGLVSYTTRYQRSGNELTIQSPLLAAGLAIEATRRRSLEPNRDWRFDNLMAVIALHPTITGGLMVPELNENFTSITGLVNSDARYNLRLWPCFNLLRHFPRVTIGLQNYANSFLKFNGGDLNTDAAGQLESDVDCLTEVDQIIGQNQDIPVNIDLKRRDGALHSDEQREFETPLSWTEYKTIRDNPYGAIAVTSGSQASVFDETFDETFQEEAPLGTRAFIERLAWRVKEQKAKIKVWMAV